MRDGFKRRAALLFAALFLIAGLLGGSVDMASAAAWSGGTENPVLNGDGSYNINTPEQLAGLAAWVNAGTNAAATYKLTADIDLGGTEWTPIGSYTSTTDYAAFSGVFDGQGFKISGLKIDSSSGYVGLFGYIAGSSAVEVKRLTIVAPNVSTSDNYAGALAGWVAGAGAQLNTGPSIYQVAVEGGSVSGKNYAGGLIGALWYGAAAKECYAITSVTTSANSTGGLVGHSQGFISIESCYAAGSISSQTGSAGGLVGTGGSSSYGGILIRASYATGPVDSKHNYNGGLVGRFSSTTNKAGLALEYSYAAGLVSAIAGKLGTGGFVGDNTTANGSPQIITSAYDPQATGQAAAMGASTGTVSIASLNTADTAWQTGAGWDAGNFSIYYVPKDGYYPQLKVFAESTQDNVKAWSALSVIQLAAGESLMALTTPFTLPTKDAAGTDLQWRIVSDGAVLAVDGDNNLYVSPDKTGEAITLTTSNGDDRWRTFTLKTTDGALTPAGVELRAVTTDITFGSIDPATLETSNSAQTVTVNYTDERDDTTTSAIYVEITKPNGDVEDDIELGSGVEKFAYTFDEEGTYVLRLKIKGANDSDIYVMDSHTLVVTKGGGDPSDIEITAINPTTLSTSASAQTLTVSYTDNTGGDTFTLIAEVTTPSKVLEIPMTIGADGKATFSTTYDEVGDYTIRVKVEIGGVTDYADGKQTLTVTKGDDPDPSDVKITGISPNTLDASSEAQTVTVSYDDTSGTDITLTAEVTMPDGTKKDFPMQTADGTGTFDAVFEDPGTYTIQVKVKKGDEEYYADGSKTLTVEEPAPDSDVTITGIKPESLKASSTEATITVEFDDESGKEIKLFAEVTVNGTPWPDLLPLEMNDDGESATFTEIFNTPGVYTIRIKVQVGDDELYYANGYKTLTITKSDDPTPDPDPVDDPIEPDNDGHVDSTVVVTDSDGNQLDITKLADTTSNGVELDKLYAMGLDCNIVDGKLHIFGDAEDIGTVTLDVYVRKSDGTETTTTVTVTINPVEHDDADTNQAVNNVAGDWTGSLTTETDSNGRRIYYFTIYVPLDLTDGNAVKVLEVGADGEACTITDENYVRDNARSTSRTNDTDSTNNARAESTLNPRVEVKGWTRTYDDAEIVDVWYRIGVHKHKRTTNVKLAETSIEDNGGWRSTGSGCDAGFGFAALAIGAAAVTLGSKRRKK